MPALAGWMGGNSPESMHIASMSAISPGSPSNPGIVDQRSNASRTGESAQPLTADELAEVTFFRGIGPERLKQIARYSKRCHFEANATIFRQGDMANCFYVVRSGRVRIECGSGAGAVPVEEIGPGEPVGFSWFYDPGIVHFSATAIGPVEAIFFYGTLLREECDIDHELGYELMRRTGQMMMKRIEALSSLVARTAAGKSSGGPPDQKSPMR